jgi:cell division topological specificity factor
MAGWLEWLTGQKNRSAGQAKDRLKLVLINDRTDLSPEQLEMLKNELLAVISRYIEIDPDEVNITMAQEGREQRLLADIPLKPAVRRRTGALKG